MPAARRRFLRYALGGLVVVAAAGTTGFELVDRDVLPGKGELDQLAGACDVSISMGGYGAIALAEKYPDLIAAVAAISPAIWTSYAQAQSANPGAYASAADFAQDDAVTHATALASVPVRVAAGHDDPFYPGVQAFARALPATAGGAPAELAFAAGCHTAPFFTAQEPPSLAFLARHLT